MILGLIGAGKMGEALLKAIAGQADVIVCEKSQERQQEIIDRYGCRGSSLKHIGESADVIILAVKPQDFENVLHEIEGTHALVISIAAGIRITKIESVLEEARVVRVMPNTPCLVGEMAAGYSFGRKATEEDAALVEKLLGRAGLLVKLPESQLDAVTGVSGSGPAFVARLIEHFAQAGIAQGLDPDVSLSLSIQTFIGTAALLKDTGMQPEELIKMVSSPNGTTGAGRAVVESSDIKDIIHDTIEAAVKRSKELGR